MMPAKRKDIYAFINSFVSTLITSLENHSAHYFLKILPTLEPHWSILCKVVEATKHNKDDWGKV